MTSIFFYFEFLSEGKASVECCWWLHFFTLRCLVMQSNFVSLATGHSTGEPSDCSASLLLTRSVYDTAHMRARIICSPILPVTAWTAPLRSDHFCLFTASFLCQQSSAAAVQRSIALLFRLAPFIFTALHCCCCCARSGDRRCSQREIFCFSISLSRHSVFYPIVACTHSCLCLLRFAVLHFCCAACVAVLLKPDLSVCS